MRRSEFLVAGLVAPFALRRGLAPAPTALVTCDAESRLAVVDLGAFRVTRSLRTPADPRSIERVGSHVVVCHTALGAVSIVDGTKVTHILRGFGEPRYVAAHPDGRHAFVTDSGKPGVVAIDARAGKVVGRLRLPDWPRHITIDRLGRRLWVALGSSSEHVAVVDTASLRRIALEHPGFGAHDVGLAPDGRLWVTAGGARELAVGRARLDADLAPQHVTFSKTRVFVTSGDSRVLRVTSFAGETLRMTPIPAGSYNVQYARGRVITPSLSAGTLTILDARGALLARVPVAHSCHDACFAAS